MKYTYYPQCKFSNDCIVYGKCDSCQYAIDNFFDDYASRCCGEIENNEARYIIDVGIIEPIEKLDISSYSIISDTLENAKTVAEMMYNLSRNFPAGEVKILSYTEVKSNDQ